MLYSLLNPLGCPGSEGKLGEWISLRYARSVPEAMRYPFRSPQRSCVVVGEGKAPEREWATSQKTYASVF